MNLTRILTEENVTRIEKKDVLFALPYFLYPSSPSGKTTDPALLPSGGAGIGLTIQVIAVEKDQGFRSLLGVEGRGLHSPKDPQTQTDNKKPFLFHLIYLRN